MKRKFYGVLMLGALAVASASLTSCKDYDDDINNLQTQVTSNSDVITQLKAAFDQGVVITDVQQDGTGVTLKTSDGKTWTISNGKDGKDATVWTIGADGYWYQDGVATTYKALGVDGKDGKDGKDGVDGKDGKDGKDGVDGKDGKDGKDGVDGKDGKNGKYYVPNVTTGCFDIYQDGVFVEATTISWAQAGITAVKGKKNVVMKGVYGVSEDIIIPTVADLASLVFIPDRYYWGVEATTIKTLKTPWWDLSRKPLTTYIDNEANRNEAVGQAATDAVEARITDYYYQRNFTTPRVNPGGVTELFTHGRYSTTGKTPTNEYYVYHNAKADSIVIPMEAEARYHINPTVADFDETSLEILDKDRLYTRAEHSEAIVTLNGDNSVNKMWSVKDGILTVPLRISYTDKLGTVKSLTTRDATDAVTTFATQATFVNAFNEQTNVTSDYACLYEEKVTNLVISHVKNHPTETDTYDDWITTGMENRHCGDCSLPAVTLANGTAQPAYSHHGMHLFASVEEAREYVMNTPRKNVTTGQLFDLNFMGEGQDLVGYHENICLDDLVETHFTNEAGQHDYFPESTLNQNFYYRFYLTSFNIGNHDTNESSHACILSKDGKSYLHPLDPADAGKHIGTDPALINNDLNNWSKTTEVVVNRVPLVRVELVYRADNKVVDFGYIPIRIVKEIVEKPATYIVFDGYQTPEWTVNSIAKCIYTVNGAGVKTTWRNTEEDLFMLANKQLGAGYDVLDRITFDAHYSPEMNGTSMQQYLAEGGKLKLDADGYPQKVQATPLKDTKIGDIYYEADDRGDGTHTNVFEWTNITLGDIQALANINEIKTNGLQRAVKLVSDDPVNYPTIYVIFKSQAIKVSNTDVTLDAHLKEHIIPEYLYAKNAYSTLGNDEIHANTMTPEDNDLTDRTRVNYWYDQTYHLLWDDLAHDRNKESGTSQWVDPTLDNSGAKNAWKPAYLDDTFSDVFLGNLKSGNTPANWITLTPNNATLLNMIRNNDLDLDFVFDDSNIGKEYKGNTDEGLRTYKLSLSANKKFIFAEDKGHLAWGKDTIAEIVVDGAEDQYGNKWNKDINRLQMMRIDYKRHTRLGYAESLLNYKGSHELNDETILATVALKAYSNINGANIAQNAGIVHGDVYCELPMINYTFDVRFLRPISIDKSKNKEIVDAYSTGTGQSGKSAQVIKISELKPSYKDWRELTWKVGTKLAAATDDYEQYYAQNDTAYIDFRIAEMTDGTNLSRNRNVMTTLGSADMNNASSWKPLYTVSEQLDFTYYDRYTDPITGDNFNNEPVLVYRNLSSTVGDFKVRIPVVIEYYWGKYYDNIEITIKRTAGTRRN